MGTRSFASSESQGWVESHGQNAKVLVSCLLSKIGNCSWSSSKVPRAFSQTLEAPHACLVLMFSRVVIQVRPVINLCFCKGLLVNGNLAEDQGFVTGLSVSSILVQNSS